MFAISLASTSSAFNSLSLVDTLSYLLVAFAVVALWRSSYRYVLIYLIGGMLYGLVIEVIQSGLVHTFALSGWNGYIAALAITWAIGAWFIYRTALDNNQEELPSCHTQHDDYKEHTPIYNNYRPRFPC